MPAERSIDEELPADEPEPALPASRPPVTPGDLIGGRYRVESALGSGGMARVYRVTDIATGRELALKQLSREHGVHQAETLALFEREFQTLVQLSHPRVIAVYDFGVDERGSFYTMELLDGGDLRERSPCGWREACALLFDVCSSLALLHSRRMTHGDLSPNNVRCTRAGHAKLIDFGAMMPMGRIDRIVGTPAFIAPEIVTLQRTDARTDLYAFGSMFYYTLTGQLPYPVYSFADLSRGFEQRPVPPSRYAPDMPAALDGLVLALLEVEPELRPRSAFEVMQRIATIAGLEQPEHLDVAKSYLSTPSLVGRGDALHWMNARLLRARAGCGGGVMISGPSGVGLSRMLEACAISAKTLGMTVLRVSGVGGPPLSAAKVLLEQLAEALPGFLQPLAARYPALDGLFSGEVGQACIDALDAPRAEIQAALCGLLYEVAHARTLVIAVDDVSRIDEASCAWLAAIAHAAAERSLLVIATQDNAAHSRDSVSLNLLAELCMPLSLSLFELPQIQELLASVFGDVPNLQLLSHAVFARSLGNVRLAMDVLWHLVDKGIIAYDRGGWTLPEELDEGVLPVADSALRERLLALHDQARMLIAGHALAVHDGFVRDDYDVMLPELSEGEVDDLLAELSAQQILMSAGRLHWLGHRVVGRCAPGTLTPAQLCAVHAGLARVFERRNASLLVAADHYLAAGLSERGVTLLLGCLDASDDPSVLLEAAGLGAEQFCEILMRALTAAEQLGRPARQIAGLRSWLLQLSIVASPRFFRDVAPLCLAQLEHDSGLVYLREPERAADSGERLMRALIRASERYQATPEAERVYKPEEAIRLLVRYVALSIGMGSKLYDSAILAPLPGLLEPFVSLSPLVYAVWQNALATLEASQRCHVLAAHQRWHAVLDRLPTDAVADAWFVAFMRNAIAFALGLLEARIGQSSAMRWVEMLDADRLQAVNAMYLRKVIRLQYGDLAGAEECRKRAELLAVQANVQPMFWSTLLIELIAHALAKDVQGVKQIRDRIRALAARYPGWAMFEHLAEAHFQRLIGDYVSALGAVDRCLELAAPEPSDPQRLLLAWPTAVAVQVEALVELERSNEAVAVAEQALSQCAELGIDVSAFGITRALALAEAKLGHYARAAERVQAVIDQQLALGVTGMHLGASYETRLLIAAWARDRAAFKHFAALTAQEYRHQGGHHALVARYAALLLDTSMALDTATTTQIASTVHVRGPATQRRSLQAQVERELASADTLGQRAGAVLRLLCEAQGASAGRLYLCAVSGLALAAHYGAQTELLENAQAIAEQLLQRETTLDEDMVTSIAPESQVTPSVVPQLLRGRHEGREMIAGVCVLVGADGSGAPRQLELVNALACYLLRTGDTPGLQA